MDAALLDRELDNLNTRDDFLNLAIELEDADEIESACEVYRSMLLAFGPIPTSAFVWPKICFILVICRQPENATIQRSNWMSDLSKLGPASAAYWLNWARRSWPFPRFKVHLIIIPIIRM